MSIQPTGLCLDSNAIIHFVEGQARAINSLPRRTASGNLRLCISELALAEVLVKPIQTADATLIRIYEELLSPGGVIDIRPVSREVLVASARNRAEFGNKGVDAIHVATALTAGCEVFVSNDKRIRMPAGLVCWDIDRTLAWAAAP